MNEIVAAPLTEMTSKLDNLHAFFIVLLVVVLAAIGIFGYVILKMILETKERAEMRNSQIEKAVQSSMGAIHAVDELKIITENHIKQYYEQKQELKSELSEFKSALKEDVQELKRVDEKIFAKIDEASKTFINYLANHH